MTLYEHESLIIFDEVQELPRALASLKYFAEDAPEYHIVAAGSLLGVTLHPGTSFPVGKVDFLRLEPLSFEEFCWALGLKDKMEYMCQDLQQNNLFKDELTDAFWQYMVVGGMPRAVVEWLDSKNMAAVDEVLTGILHSYRNDFSKHTDPLQAERMNLIWPSIPAQFAKEHRRFVYGVARPGARAREYELSIAWLVDAGLVRKVYSVSSGDKLPLEAYKDIQAFKLYLLDLGLLGAMVDAPAKNILIGDNVFKEYKGAFTEQYVAQQIVACNVTPKYYNNENSTNEIDFVVQLQNVYPIEVKAEENLKSKSMNTLLNENEDMEGWKFSMSTYRTFKQVVNIPLYDVDEWILMYKEKMLEI